MTDSALQSPLLDVDAEISRFETGLLSPVRFATELEQRFHDETSGQRSRMLMMQGILALCAYDFFIVGDYYMGPQNIGRAVLVRFGIVTPLVLLISFLMRKQSSHVLQESAATFLCLAGTVSVLYLHYNVGPLITAEAQTGLILILLVVNCMMRLEMPYAAATSAFIVFSDCVSLATDPFLPRSQKMVSGGMLFWVGVLAMAANYSLTRERRYSYLLQLRGRLQRTQLADANAELQAISLTDRLTGIPNRRAYEDRLTELWAITRERREPMSAVMVDVDHFKRLNDNHGHPYGDRVLQRVASLLIQSLRAEDDFVARFGGEEFVVLLPNAPPDIALKVAERIRTLVQVAGSPALQRDTVLQPQEMFATVSCGVATVSPWLMPDPSRLIADADAAMYRAKQDGRNRVCCAAPYPSSNSKVAQFPSAASRA